MTRTTVPAWLRAMVRDAKRADNPALHALTAGRLAGYRLHTVCDGARCPNKGSCYSHGTATFLILGNTCTRSCAFCAVDHGCPPAVDPEEPRRLAAAVAEMGLTHVVVTSVTRDDLPDGGAGQFAAVINELRKLPGRPRVEVLTPDFRGAPAALATVLAAGPEVFAHNVETVPRLYLAVRPGAEYRRSVNLLAQAARTAKPGTEIKTGIMLGLGEEEAEVMAVLEDVRAAGVTMITLGQYLAPTGRHYPVQRYVPPAEFAKWAEVGRQMGFKSVAAGPLVRSSYHAGEFYREIHV